MSKLLSSVIPGRREAASPESITPAAAYGFRTASLHSASGMTVEDCLNASRLSDARLQAVSSRNMYSEHGFEARIGPEFGQVCQSLTVVWNCRPGSAQAQAAWPIFSHKSRAFRVLATLP